MKSTVTIAGLFLITASLGFFLPASFARADAGLTIQPIKVSHTLKPGESVTGAIMLTNASSGSVNVALKAEDFVPLQGGEGIKFVGRTEGVTTVRDWISINAPSPFIFEKGASRSISYTITAPPNAEPGSHFGVLFLKANDLNEGQLKVGTQVGVLVFVTVPGNFLQKGKLLDFTGHRFIQKGPVLFRIRFENTGTVHFEPKGTISITNIWGKKVGEAPVSGQAVLPTGIKDLRAVWEPSGLLLGKYAAAIALVDGEGNELTADRFTFFAFPISYLLGFIALALVLYFGLRFIRRRLNISISLK